MDIMSLDNSCSAESNPLYKLANSKPNAGLHLHQEIPQSDDKRGMSSQMEVEFAEFKSMNMVSGRQNEGGYIERIGRVEGAQNESWVSQFNNMNLQQRQNPIYRGISEISGPQIQRPWVQEQSVPRAQDQRIREAKLQEIVSDSGIQQDRLWHMRSPMQSMSSAASNVSVREEAKMQETFDAIFHELESSFTGSREEDAGVDVTEEAASGEAGTEEVASSVDKQKFADMAKQVYTLMNETPNSVSSDTQTKFKESKFMQLMEKVATRKVEISQDGEAFVQAAPADTSGSTNTMFDGASAFAQGQGFSVKSSDWQGEFV